MRVSLLLVWVACLPAGIAAQNCAPNEASLISLWKGEGDAVDVLRNHDGTLEGSVSFGEGKVGSAFYLDENSYITVPDAPALNLLSSSSFTLDGWGKATHAPNNAFIAVTLTKPYYYGLLYHPEQRYFRAHVSDGRAWIYADAPYDLPLGQWTHVAQTWDRS